jgi:hypothetical protein
MRRFILATCCAFFLVTAPAAAQYRWHHEGYRQVFPSNADALVQSWYQRFLHRTPANGEHLGWVNALASGQAPDMVLSGILGSPEYYNNAGGTPEGFIDNLFVDLNGRTATEQEFRYWMGRLQYGYADNGSRTSVAYAMLVQYPQNWGGGSIAPVRLRYDRSKVILPRFR